MGTTLPVALWSYSNRQGTASMKLSDLIPDVIEDWTLIAEDMQDTATGEFQYIEGWDDNGPHAMYFPTGVIIIACERELI